MKKYHGAFIKNEREVACLREANRMVANILDAVGAMAVPGVPTMRLEELARDMCADYKVKPAFLGYCGYPFALCCSVNEQVVHGFPSDRVLQEGDIVSADMGVVFEGFVGDAARTFPVGTVSEDVHKLLKVTEESLYVGIEQARAGNDVYSIGGAVQDYVEAAGFNVVRRFVGHGVGSRMHEKPEVPNFRPGMKGLTLQNGMVIAIEPFISEKERYVVEDKKDGWTLRTPHWTRAAQCEHTIMVTEKRPVILTLAD